MPQVMFRVRTVSQSAVGANLAIQAAIRALNAQIFHTS